MLTKHRLEGVISWMDNNKGDNDRQKKRLVVLGEPTCYCSLLYATDLYQCSRVVIHIKNISRM